MNSCKTCLDYKETFKGKGICKLYDEYVNKVVEQLKEYERYVYDAVSDEDNYVIDTEKAIEIVSRPPCSWCGTKHEKKLKKHWKNNED